MIGMKMTTLNTDLESTRIFSLFSEKVHFVTHNNKEYMCFAGIVCPKSFGYTIALWSLSNSKRYRNLFHANQSLRSEIFELNQHDPYLSQVEKSHDIEWYLCRKMGDCMKTWQPIHFEELFG